MSKQKAYTLKQVRKKCKKLKIGEECSFKLSQSLTRGQIGLLAVNINRDREGTTKGAVSIQWDGTELHARAYIPTVSSF